MLSSILLAASALAFGVSANTPEVARDIAVAAAVDIRLPVNLVVGVDVDVDAKVEAKVDINLLNLVDIKVDADIEAKIQANIDLWVGPEPEAFWQKKWYASRVSGSSYSNLTHAACEFNSTNPSDPKAEVDFLLSLEVGAVGLDVQVGTIFGILTPYSGYPYAWKYTGTGALLSVTAEITLLAYGRDANGNEFIVLHNSDFIGLGIGAGIVVYSASREGVAAVTIDAIVAASVDLNILDINVLVQVFVALGVYVDIGVDIELLGGCDALCRANQNTRNFPLLSIGSRNFKA